MNWKVLFIGLFGCWADASTSWLASKYPQLAEGNVRANPFLETASVLAAQTVILEVGEKAHANPKATVAIALFPAALPLVVAANNVARVAIVEAQTYPWDKCPLLYPQT